MVSSHPNSIGARTLKQRILKRGRFIYITGCDGTGKTTQAALMMQRLRNLGEDPLHLWLRFPFLTSVPLLAYARWRGYSYYEEIISETGNLIRHGYWDFDRSWLLRIFLPWFLLIDVAIAAVRKVYWPIWCGETIVCERFAIDTMIDLSVGLADPDFIRKVPGKLFLRIVPDLKSIVLLDLSEQEARSRREDLVSDQRLTQRLSSYREAAKIAGLTMVSTDRSIEQVFDEVVRRIRIK